METYYEILGVPPNASSEAIQAAYRALAKSHHPDLNPDNPEAEARFKLIAEANATLSDDGLRADYDETGLFGERHEQIMTLLKGEFKRALDECVAVSLQNNATLNPIVIMRDRIVSATRQASNAVALGQRKKTFLADLLGKLLKSGEPVNEHSPFARHIANEIAVAESEIVRIGEIKEDFTQALIVLDAYGFSGEGATPRIRGYMGWSMS